MSENVDFDVLIVGAGPTGMSAALALCEAGYDVMIIDKHQNGLSYSRAILVNSKTLSLLKPYGVADQIMTLGQPCRSITISGPNGVILDGAVDISGSSDVYPTLLPQLSTEKCLTEALIARDVIIDRPTTFKWFEQKETHVESILEKDNKQFLLRSKYLLGADGFHSAVRQGLGISYNQTTNPIVMYSQDAVIEWSGRSDTNIWILNTGAALAMRIGDKNVRFAATNKQTFLALGFTKEIEQTTWESEFDVYFAHANAFGDGRVWLAGDAAHVHSPVGGRGMNMGIADGISFAQAVINNDFMGYQKDRHAISSDWVRKNRLFTELMCDQSIKGRVGRATVRLIFKLISALSGKNAANKVFKAIAIG